MLGIDNVKSGLQGLLLLAQFLDNTSDNVLSARFPRTLALEFESLGLSLLIQAVVAKNKST